MHARFSSLDTRICRAVTRICLGMMLHPTCNSYLFYTLALNPSTTLSRSVTLTREEVEEACSGVAAGVSKACREALRAAGIGAEDVGDVELLGGGSYIPLLRRSVESTFGR